MSGNSFGKLLKLTTYGESHGPAIGGVLEGCPAGLEIDLEQIQAELERRKPGQSKIVTQRKEPDQVVFYSGVFEGKTTGTPIGLRFTIPIKNQRITATSKTITVLLMRITFTIKNTASGITGEAGEVLPVKRRVG